MQALERTASSQKSESARNDIASRAFRSGREVSGGAIFTSSLVDYGVVHGRWRRHTGPRGYVSNESPFPHPTMYKADRTGRSSFIFDQPNATMLGSATRDSLKVISEPYFVIHSSPMSRYQLLVVVSLTKLTLSVCRVIAHVAVYLKHLKHKKTTGDVKLSSEQFDKWSAYTVELGERAATKPPKERWYVEYVNFSVEERMDRLKALGEIMPKLFAVSADEKQTAKFLELHK
jgi:hypothetical protein